MFTSLSANVGFNPLLAGVLAVGAAGTVCLPQQRGWWPGLIYRGRGHPLHPPWLGQKQMGGAFPEVTFQRLRFLQSR